MRPDEPASPTAADGVTTVGGLVQVAPAQLDTRLIVAGGTVVWLILAVVFAVAFGVGRHGHAAWFWTALAGFVLGLLGLILVAKHRAEGRTK